MSALVFSVCSPIAELFPNLYLSWWRPANGNTSRYLALWYLRVLVVMIVWVPILMAFGQLVPGATECALVSCLVAAAFALRLWTFDRHLARERSQSPSSLPEMLYVVAFSWIGVRLFGAVPSHAGWVPFGIVLLFGGAGTMAHFREHRPSVWPDRLGRVLFTTGFMITLFNLYRASS